MDMLEHNLHTSLSNKQEERKVVQIPEADTGDKVTAVTSVSRPSAVLDGNFHYQFHAENTGGQVTYRVIQVSDGLSRGAAVNVLSPVNLTGHQQAVTQTVIQHPFRNGGSAVRERTREEARCAYFPEASVSERTGTALPVQAAGDPSLTQTTGQFYVMMTPPEMLYSAPQRTIAPRTHAYTAKMDSPRTPRDERRRAQHNEVERRRRDKINNWIVTLSKIIPDCSMESTKTSASKGGILSKACDYIGELQEHNQRLQETLRDLDRVQIDHDLLGRQLQELKSENILLRTQLERHGIEAVPDASAQ
ncbi:upstream stimulatory factor 2 isoform X1 [Triplophysa dalaica]|uniref:upstream stimulatory factor 2 isoform X1 n=1 Tax=Triplophysa dalaica TaxID=1582913 RepID=UPI0024DF8FE0|nr:upstream stimulatory factor 2 isoform X1 [Triplophysa dalaica]